MFMLNDKPLPLDTPFTVGEGDEAIQYPANWLRLASAEEKAAIGITEVADAVAYDDRFYWGVDNPKELPQLKTQWVAQTKDTAGKLLNTSDWMIIRKVERNVDVPAKVVSYREAVVAEANRLEIAINAAADVPALIEVVQNQGWPVNE